MKKSLLALAVAAALPAAAQAQSSVTLYGVADAGFTYGTDKRLKFANTGVNGVPRLGIRGTEPLGNTGLSAVFQLETGYNQGREGITYLGNRGAFVGLSGKMGTVTFGSSVLSPSFWAMNEVDPTFSSNYTLNQYGGPARLDNSINYAVTLGSLTLRAAHVSDNDALGDSVAPTSTAFRTDLPATGATDVSAIWKAGALTLVGAYSQLSTVGQSGYTLGGSYDLKFAKVFASYVDSEITGITATTAGTSTRFGVNIPLGQLLATVEYRKLDADDNTKDANTFMAAATYSLSNRTTINAYVQKPNTTKLTAGLGLRHNF